MLGRVLSTAAKKTSSFTSAQTLRSNFFNMQKRTMVLGGGKPTAFRQDSLLVACTIAALTYYVPQDLVFLTLLGMYKRAETGLMGGKTKCANPHAAFAEWKSTRGSLVKNSTCYGSGSCYYATV
ncbi:unnamed protein product [Amoebophrya sp. A120]|nr:unnamed protein product [Amoebophrya sp. A120]CAD7931854.1 unnamed protein product [Amoebophrya sp. A120]|eukprot:GSA120T00021088001.1